MKSILLSIKPEWVAKILNGEKTIEVRKKFPKDYVGWVYIYCTKEDSLCCIKRIDRDRYICGKDFDIRDFPYLSSGYEGKGKVVARFWCDKVEYIENIYDEFRWGEEDYKTETLNPNILYEKSCLSFEEMDKYLKGKQDGYAIHISKLEIFDKPRELIEFTGGFNRYKVPFHNGDFYYHESWDKPLFKAPQNYCYVEGEE